MAPMSPERLPTAETVRCAVDGRVATVTLDRPPYNGMTAQMADEMYDLLEAIAADRSLGIVVVTGAGGPGSMFCPGADIRHLLTEEGSAQPRRRSYRVPVLLHEMPQVTVAAVNGAAAGAGLGWACACDLRVAAESARFNTAFLQRGVAGDMGLPWSLPRLVGAAKARELFLLSEKFDAAEALRANLVCKVFPDGSFAEDLDRFVAGLAALDGEALRAAKAHFVEAERLGFDAYVDVETDAHVRQMSSEAVRRRFGEFLDRG